MNKLQLKMELEDLRDGEQDIITINRRSHTYEITKKKYEPIYVVEKFNDFGHYKKDEEGNDTKEWIKVMRKVTRHIMRFEDVLEYL